MFLISKDFSEILLLILLGFVQFIESTPVAEVLDKDVDGSIQVEFKTRYTVTYQLFHECTLDTRW